NPRMCRAAGEVADGFHVHPMHSAPYLTDVVKPALNEGAKISGREVDDLELYSPVFVITGETQEETDAMERTVRQQLAFYGSTPSYAAVLEYHGLGELSKKLNKLMREGDTEAMSAAVPESLVEHVAIIAKPGDVGARIRERYEGILDRVSLYMAMGGDGAFNRWNELIEAIHA
ncbi:MAG: LLM class flavin-dependent oxidoreductase, partial [Pseudomonadota bacterium]|nr:LLM class flavin-dependent oxidoreductase [Pseudomonadota bacterium]